MKTKIYILLFLAVFATAITAQPNKIKYQGVARNSSGNALVSQSISLRISIRKSSTTGTVVYQETHTTTTNQFGLFYVNVGAGTVVSGTFSGIKWGDDDYFQETEMDPAGGTSYTSMGVSQLLSVPYALHAKNGASHGFLATNSATQSVGANTEVTLSFDTESLDDGSNFSSSTFTVPDSGFYHFQATVVWQIAAYTQSMSNTTGTWQLELGGASYDVKLMAGSDIVDIATYASVPRNNTEFVAMKINTNVFLPAGKTVFLKAYNAHISTGQSIPATYSHFSGYKIY